jgi:choline dehydrogenase-like flavoprotein
MLNLGEDFFISGSSTFPSGGHANPILTILQLSFRLSDYIQYLITKIS